MMKMASPMLGQRDTHWGVGVGSPQEGFSGGSFRGGGICAIPGRGSQ